MRSHDKNKLSICITYLDTNNLYGWAMIQYLPTGRFKWPMHRLKHLKMQFKIGNIVSY